MSQFLETADIETSSDEYASRFSGSAGKWMLAVQEKIALGLMASEDGGKVLDVGGGHGQLAGAMAAKGFDVTVLGSSESCANRIQKDIDCGNLKFQVGDIINMPYKDNEFDIVISIRLLPHCERWEKLVAEMCRVAKRAVIVDYPTGQSLNCLSGALFGAKKKIEGNTRPYRLFSHREVVSAFERCSFKKLKVRPEFFVPMVVHRMLKCPGISGFLEFVFACVGLRRFFGSPVLARFESGK